MVSSIIQTPLNWNVPIVDKNGRPTNEFMQKWARMLAINGTIPTDITTPEQVSTILDLLGATQNDVLMRGVTLWAAVTGSDVLDVIGNTPGDLLQRGASVWDVKTLTQLLDQIGSVDGDILIRSGGAWSALASPADATMFLDGTGVYSTPAGGGGGGKTNFGVAYGGPFTSTFGGGGVDYIPFYAPDGAVVEGAAVKVFATNGSTKFTFALFQDALGTASPRPGLKLAETIVTTGVVLGTLYEVPFISPYTVSGDQLLWLATFFDTNTDLASGPLVGNLFVGGQSTTWPSSAVAPTGSNTNGWGGGMPYGTA